MENGTCKPVVAATAHCMTESINAGENRYRERRRYSGTITFPRIVSPSELDKSESTNRNVGPKEAPLEAASR